MAHYPADTFQEAVDLSITASNQLHKILNGDSTTEITVEDGSKIPSVRKAYTDSLFFLSPQPWTVWKYETVYNQLRAFVEPTGITTWWFSKLAAVSTPILMSTTPHEDSNWTLWNATNNSVYEIQKRLATEAGLNMVGSFLLGATVTTTDDVVFYETDGKYYGWGGSLPKVVSAGSTPATSGGVGIGAWVDRTDVTLRSDLNIVVKVFASVADMIADASLVVGQKCRTLGYYSVGDGGANDYEIVAAATGTDDGGSYIDLSGSGYQAKGLFVNDVVNVKQFGAKYGIDSSLAFQSAIDTLGISGGVVKVPFDEYSIGDIDIRSYTHVCCDHGTIIKPSNNSVSVFKIDASLSTTLADTLDKTKIRNRVKITGCIIDNRVSLKTNVVGINFIGVNVYSINDFHILDDVEIHGCEYGIYVSGRQIWSSYKDVHINVCEHGYYSSAISFNANTFINMRVRSSDYTGVYIPKSQTISFIGCNFEDNNTLDQIGYHGIELSDADNPTLLNCYLENNGVGVVWDGTTKTNNSASIKLSGVYINNIKISGCYLVGSGIGVISTATVINGGSIETTRFNTVSVTGSTTAIYIDSNAGPISGTVAISPLMINGNCTFDQYSSTFIEIPIDGNGRRGIGVNQVNRDYWIGDSAVAVDLVRTNCISVFPYTGAKDFKTFYNMIPGCELSVYNFDATNNVTINTAVCAHGTITILPQTMKKIKVIGYPNIKFVEIQ